MKALLLIGAIFGTLVLAGTATAAGEGADVTNASFCTTSPFATVCQELEYVVTTETTPSGNVSFVMNGTTTRAASIPLAGCTSGETNAFHEHWLMRGGDLQTESRRGVQTTYGQCGGFSYTCVLTVQIHFVNGETQIQHDDFVCTDSFGV